MVKHWALPVRNTEESGLVLSEQSHLVKFSFSLIVN